MNNEEESKLQIIAYCGINCGECNIYLAPNNPQIAVKLVELFNGKWEKVKAEDFHCETCRKLVDKCWTEECWIRNCCQEKKLEYCFECEEFPCYKLKEWSRTNKRYKQAFQTLKNMKKQKKRKKE
jgi:hypothetical protein